MTRPGHYGPRDEKYEDSPSQVRHREERNKNRREFKASGKVLPGNRDIAHINPLDRGGGNTRSNLKVETVKKNRSWRKGESGYKVPKDK